MKKAQIKMFETVGVLVVFFFLLVAGSVFYFSAQTTQLKRDNIKASEQLAFQIALKALYLPELDCSFLLTQKNNCIDIYKLDALSELLQEDQARVDYFERFGYSTIKITEYYPGSREIVLYSNEPYEVRGNERIRQYDSNFTSLSPILLFNATNNHYRFGVIQVVAHV